MKKYESRIMFEYIEVVQIIAIVRTDGEVTATLQVWSHPCRSRVEAWQVNERSLQM